MMRLVRAHALQRRPRVSVVIPCYNYGRFLPEAVGSALDQAGVEVDVLIVDDASTDGSEHVAHALARAHPNVRVLAHETNCGHLRTYNDGLQAVDGEYVVLISADDQLAPGCLARSTALLDRYPSVGFVYGYPQTFEVSPERAPAQTRSWSIWNGPQWFAGAARAGRNRIFCPEVVMRADLLASLGYYDLGLPHSADMDLWYRAAAISDVGRVNGSPQAYYRVHGANMHLTQFAGVLHDLRERLRTWDGLFDTVEPDGFGPGRLASLRRRCHVSIAHEALGVAASAYDAGRAGQVPVAELASFACQAWPEITTTLRWRLLERRRRLHDTGRRLHWAQVAAASQDLNQRVQWRRWRRYGV